MVFAALFAIAAARPSYLASSPVVYSPHYVQPVARAHYAVPVVRTVVHSPVVHVPVFRTVPVVHAAPVLRAAPVYHSYGAVPVARSYGHIYVPYKNKVV